MTAAPILDVADEVVEVINDAEVSVGVPLLGVGNVAVCEYNPSMDLKDICERRCIVYPARNASEQDFSRHLTAHEYEIQILVQEKLPKPLGSPEVVQAWKDKIRELTGLVDSVADLFRGGVYLSDTKCNVIEVDVDPIYVPEHLDQKNLFSSVIILLITQARTS